MAHALICETESWKDMGMCHFSGQAVPKSTNVDRSISTTPLQGTHLHFWGDELRRCMALLPQTNDAPSPEH